MRTLGLVFCLILMTGCDDAPTAPAAPVDTEFTLAPHEIKYSTLVLDGSAIDANDIVVVGINQAQRAGSDAWWRAELQRAAEAAVPLKKK